MCRSCGKSAAEGGRMVTGVVFRSGDVVGGCRTAAYGVVRFEWMVGDEAERGAAREA